LKHTVKIDIPDKARLILTLDNRSASPCIRSQRGNK
jgi:hypothetical protein